MPVTFLWVFVVLFRGAETGLVNGISMTRLVLVKAFGPLDDFLGEVVEDGG